MSNQPNRNDRPINKGRKPRGEYAVLDQNIRGHDVKNEDSEVNNVVPTGNLSEDEHRLLLRYQDMLEGVRTIEDRLDIELPVKERILEKINFLVHSSKSIEGFGIEKIATKELREDSRVTHQQAGRDSRSAVDRIKEQVGGDTQFADPVDEEAW